MGIARLLIPLGILPEKLSTSISERVCHVNKLKFHIVEFWNKYNPDPNMPDDFNGDRGEGMFEFEKIMK